MTQHLEKIMCICSGGMDSYTLLHHVIFNNPKAEVKMLSFNYGQRHVRELEFAKQAADELKIQHLVFDMPGIGKLLNGSSLTSDIAVPEGHYAAPNMKLTVVPGRNTIMLSIAMGIAEAWARQTDERVGVFYGAHSGDHTIYPDCRPDYYEALRGVYWEATEDQVELFAPYIHISKTDILAIGKRLALDYSKTWSCYNGGEHPCGKCGACNERAEAFLVNNMIDPMAVNVPPVMFVTDMQQDGPPDKILEVDMPANPGKHDKPIIKPKGRAKLRTNKA